MTNSTRFEDEIWKFKSNNPSYIDFYTFDFNGIKPESFKTQLKEFVLEVSKYDSLEIASVHRYFTSVKKHFLGFLEYMELDILYFSDLNADIADAYIFYLIGRSCMKESTKNLSIASVKSILKYGRTLNLSNYPKTLIFPKGTSRMFGVDDELRSGYLAEGVINQIKYALMKEKKLFTRAVITLAMETGLRLSEVLHLQKGCLLEDFAGHPILCTYSEKVDDEIYVPVSQDAKKVIEELETRYIENESEYLFWHIGKRKTRLYLQKYARTDLDNFLENHQIKDSNNEPAKATYHSFRHTVGTTMLNNGATIHQVKTQLNHRSYHSTNLYAKMKDKTVDKEYYRMPVLGLQLEEVQSEICAEKYIRDTHKGSLPDGVCLNTIKEDGSLCNHFNSCLLCNMFRTFRDDLPTHRAHLERIREDRIVYLEEENINSINKLYEIESALETIIERLEII